MARKNVLQRTLGDILCDVSQLGRIQKWVTLQPNNEYNNYEACNVKARLDLRAVAEEIAAELGAMSLSNVFVLCLSLLYIC